MGVEIEGLEFQVEAKTGRSIEGVEKTCQNFQ